VRRLKQTEGGEQRKVLLVGHSLGGGIAKVVGCKTSSPAVALASPGIVDSRGKLNVSLSAIHDLVINLYPQHDVASWLGVGGGLSFNIPCSLQRPDACHARESRANTFIHRHTHPHTHTHTHAHTHTYAHTHIITHSHTHAHMHTRSHVERVRIGHVMWPDPVANCFV
jgi:hypothetical protein